MRTGLTNRQLGQLDVSERYLADVLRQHSPRWRAGDLRLLEKAHCALQAVMGRQCAHDIAGTVCSVKAGLV